MAASIAASPLRRRVATSCHIALGLSALSGCSDSTGPGAGPGGWEYTAPASITAPRTVTLAPELLTVSAFGGTTHIVLDPSTGREKFRIEWPAGGVLYRAGSTLILASGSGSAAGTSRAYDAGNGGLRFALNDSSQTRQVFGTIGAVLVSAINDTVLEGHSQGNGSLRWRRTLPTIACTRFCGTLLSVDVIGETMTLYRVTDVAAALFRVTPDGTTMAIASDREVFRSASAVRFAVRSAVSAPIVAASSRGIAALDPVSGATTWRTAFSALVPAGYFSQSGRSVFSADGAWLAVRMVDSGGTAMAPSRDIILRTDDGTRVRERVYSAEQSNDLFAGPCATAGMVRVLPDLRLEYTDLVTGVLTVSSVIPALSALRSTPTVTGFLQGAAASAGTTLLVSDQVSGKLSGVGCRV